jgi:lipoyl(octanoyl) transferase
MRRTQSEPRKEPPTARIAWAKSSTRIDYLDAVRAMQERTTAIAAGTQPELVWLLEHPPVYTAGTGSRPEDLLVADRFPVVQTGRGGRLTYHGPGQRVAYVMLDVQRRGGDVRAFVTSLEDWLIGSLADLGVSGEKRAERIGVWVRRPEKGPGVEEKIAALGLRISKGVSLHGISLNVDPDLSHYDGIVPCGIAGHGVTSLADLDVVHAMEVVDKALRRHFEARFGPTADAEAPCGRTRIAASA